MSESLPTNSENLPTPPPDASELEKPSRSSWMRRILAQMAAVPRSFHEFIERRLEEFEALEIETEITSRDAKRSPLEKPPTFCQEWRAFLDIAEDNDFHG
jgi:hypothetical protein